MKNEKQSEPASETSMSLNKIIKVIKIDSAKKEISIIEISENTRLSQHLDCERITSVRLNQFGDYLYVDDEGLYREDLGGFALGDYVYAGHGLLVGTDEEGENCAPWLDVDMASRAIRFIAKDKLPNPNELIVEKLADGSGVRVVSKRTSE